MTVREALAWAMVQLKQAGAEDGRRIAMLLLGDAAKLDASALLLNTDTALQDGALANFYQMIKRACAQEPVQYILGWWDFYGRTFRTDRRALIPRPETERLVEEALAVIPIGQTFQVIDVGCGTGCIGITLKLERPEASVTLADVSEEALSLASENAIALKADAACLHADMLKPLPGGPYDVIASNPPYINGADMAGLAASVREHEPHLALYGGEDGLVFVRALALRAAESLKPGGWLFIEIGYDQAEKAAAIMKAAGLEARAISDYSGVLRVIAARKEL